MPLSKPNWKSLYRLQDEVLQLLKDKLSHFYLTGGTALSRYYLQHRYSEDLDFFCHNKEAFEKSVNTIARILATSKLLDEQLVQISETYARFFVGPMRELKIDFVYEDIEPVGGAKIENGIKIDNPTNILANKLCCIVGRDEPKDLFDIVSIAEAYSFVWKDVFWAAKAKQLLDETDVTIRLQTFPVELLNNVNWTVDAIDLQRITENLKQITQDFVLGSSNSLGIAKPELPTYI